MPQLQAERQLAAIEAASVAHMDKSGRSEVFAKYSRAVNADTKPRRPALGDLAGIGIAVEEVTADSPAANGTQQDTTEADV